MKLGKLVESLERAVLVKFSERGIRGLALDSRKVRPGYLFAVVPGPRCDGSRYVPDAVGRGAVAVLASRKVMVPPDVALVLVPDVRVALAELSCRFYGRPAELVQTVGITGTNGKTTVAALVRSLLTNAGRQAALISTVVHQIGSRILPAANTTPESPELQGYFAEMVERHIRYAVMEVSSQGLDQHRVLGIPFAVAAMTNVTPHEHLDYHGTFEAYRRAKARLFETLAEDAAAVLNADDPSWRYFADRCQARKMTYGLDSRADVRASVEAADLDGTTFTLYTPAGRAQVRSRLIGLYNVQNALAGVCCGLALGLDLATIVSGIERFEGAPGRLERVDIGQGFTVLVDYAHNHEGLRAVLGALRLVLDKGARLIVVFGAGGDRDPTKRPLMGEVASALADIVVLTADNSRSEDTREIIKAIRSGVVPERACIEEPDRRAAIRQAIALARPGDVVLIAGKGHERYQDIGGVKYQFDDREEARRALLSLALSHRAAGSVALSAGGLG